MMYFVRTPLWMSSILKNCIWRLETEENELFLSFDDGPHPVVTPFVLDELRKFNAKATFFCLGKNVADYPDIYKRILDEGHRVGNHTYSHLNGWKVKNQVYLDDIRKAQEYIDSNLFRPPYGKINPFLVNQLASPLYNMKTIMWSLLSGDFDEKLAPAKCAENVILHAKPGDIIVFHDSEKASSRLYEALPAMLKYFSGKGWDFKVIN